MTEEALLMLYQSLEPRLRTIACYILGNNSPDIEDVLQDALFKAWRKRDTVRCEANIAGWLWRIVRNESVSLLRRRIRSCEYLTDDFSRFHDSSSFEEQLMNQMVMMPLIRKLRFPYNDAVILHYIQGYKIHEISAIIQRPENTVKGLLSRARKMMQSACR